MDDLIVIIPTLNEAKNIKQTIGSVQSQAGSPALWVVDGGSTDDTVQLAMKAGAKVLKAPRKGRGLQMNLGWRTAAQKSTRGWFLFLHGDSQLPRGYKSALETVIRTQQQLGVLQTEHEVNVQSSLSKGTTQLVTAYGGVPGPRPVPAEPEGSEPSHPSNSTDGMGSAAAHAVQGLRTRNRKASRPQQQPQQQQPLLQSPFPHAHTQPPQHWGMGQQRQCLGTELMLSCEKPWQHPQQQQAQEQQQQGHKYRQSWLWPWEWFWPWRTPQGFSGKPWGTPMISVLGPHRHVPPLWGCFRTIRTELEDTFNGRVLSGGVTLRTGLLGMPYGDQGIFVHRSALIKLGGLREWPLLEDVDLVHRLKHQASPPAVLPLDMYTSGRRWLHTGFWRNAAFNQLVLGAWALGVDPRTLANWYYRPCHKP